MHQAPRLCLTALATLSLLSMGCGEEQQATAEAMPQLTQTESREPSPHPIFDHWQEVLDAESAHSAFCSREEGKPLSEEDLSEVNEIQEHVAHALKAGKALYEARLDILRDALYMPDCHLLNSEDSDMDGQVEALLAPCKKLLAEGFRRDLEALGASDGWLRPGRVKPGLRPGRQELLFRPPLESLAMEQVNGCTAEISLGYSDVNDRWEKRQNRLMAHLLELYGGGELSFEEAGMRAPITFSPWQTDDEGKMTRATRQFRRDMQMFIRREQQAWEQYRDAMKALVCPSMGYRGSGMGAMMSLYECHLLDTRERFLCLLTTGFEDINMLFDLPVERQAELRVLHPEYPYGEIFGTRATLFRHPELEGNPWCIRFPDAGAGFIFVPDARALQEYTREHPQGGEVWVMGYQSVESVGTPYRRKTLLNTRTCSRFRTDPPADAMKLRQVFRLLRCMPAEQAPQEVEYEGEYTPGEDADE